MTRNEIKEFLKIILYIILISIALFFLIVFLLLAVENKEELTFHLFGKYPAQGDYLVSFQERDGSVSATVTYRQYIYKNEILDTSNLLIYTEQINKLSYYINEDIINNEDIIDNRTKFREILLGNGLADIIDESLATEAEIKSQNSARNKKTGHWHTNESASVITGKEKSEISAIDIINWLISFSKSFLFFIIKCFIAIVGSGTIVGIISKIVRRNNVDVIFGGELSSGKTTIFKRLENPEISESELLSITSTKSTKKQKGNRIAVGKRDIYPLMLDNPGQQYADIFDGINKRFLCNPHRILIYTIALFPENKSDEDIHKNDQYRIGQIHKAIQLLSIVLKSKSVKSLDKIIVFVNKMDLLYEKEVDFSNANRNNEGINLLKTINGFEELNEIIANSPKVGIIYGSALKGWGIYKIRDIIKGLI